jgi:hypothetical protein
LIEDPGLDAVAAKAREQGFAVMQAAPDNAILVKGMWPGVRLSRSKNADTVSAGPTGEAWVNTNGWKVRLTAALHPGMTVWVDAPPQEDSALLKDAYVVAISDAAMYGGRWIISLDSHLAAAINAQREDALNTWREMMRALDFFSAHKSWSSEYFPEAVVGVLSDFAGGNASFSQEALNLLARTNTQYRILLRDEVKESNLTGLKALLCVDADPPPAATLQPILGFVERGGLLVAGPGWTHLPGTPDQWCDNPRYTARTFGQGRMAIANSALNDPYLFASDSVVLVSHRNDLLRFWNAGAMSTFLTAEPDRKKTVLQMLFFAKELNGRVTPGQGPDTASVRVTGQYKAASLLGPDRSGTVPVQMEVSKDAVELHLPSVAQFAAVELES